MSTAAVDYQPAQRPTGRRVMRTESDWWNAYVRYRQPGQTLGTVAETLGVDPSNLGKGFRRRGFVMRSCGGPFHVQERMSPEQWEEARELHVGASGPPMRMEDIAARYGVHPDTVRAGFRRRGWPVRYLIVGRADVRQLSRDLAGKRTTIRARSAELGVSEGTLGRALRETAVNDRGAGRKQADLLPRKCEGCGAMFERARRPSGALETPGEFLRRRFCERACQWLDGAVKREPGLHAEGCGGCETCLTVTPGPEPMARYSVACDCGIVLSAEDATSSDPWAEVIGALTAHGRVAHRMGEDAAHDAALFAWVVRGQRVETEVAAA